MLAKMSENDFETRQMCRSPQCVCPSTIWDQSRGLMNNELEKEKEILQQMQSRRCFSYNKIFKADLSQTSPDSKNRRRSLRRCQFSLLLYYFSQQYLFCTIFWKVFGTLCVLLYWYYVPGDAFWSCFGLVRTSLLANSPRVQSHVHSPTDRNVLCTRAKHVEAYGSWLRCDGALLYSSIQYT